MDTRHEIVDAPSEGRRERALKRSFIMAIMAIIPGMMMVMIDSTAMNVAVPSLSRDFEVTFETLQWVITGYMLAMSITIPLAGWFSDRLGEAKAYIITVILFLFGSLLCALAQNADQLIAFRVVQGLGGGMVQPIGMAMVFRLAPAEKKGQVMGMLGIPMLLAPASGPILSGWLLESVSWHWIFLINLPLGVITVFLGLRYLHNSSLFKAPSLPRDKKSLDILGLILAPIAFVLIALSINISSVTWGAWLMAILGVMLLIWLWVHETRHPYPILELKAFRKVSFRRGMFVSWIQYVALNGSIVFIPQYLQNFKGYSPFQAGLVMSMLAVTSGLLMPVGGRIFDRVGIRPLASTGLGIIAFALVLLSQMNTQADGVVIAGIVGLMGVGMGLCMMSLNTYILQSAPKESTSRVTPLISASSDLIIPISIAGLSHFLTLRAAARVETAGNITSVAEVAAYSDTFMLAACIAIFGVLLSLLLRTERG